MNLFYYTGELNESIRLNEAESKHCIRVLRLSEGDFVWVTNGLGTMVKTEIGDGNPKACVLQPVETHSDYNKRNFSLHLAVSPLQLNDRFEWFLEKAVEIGIDRITPIVCERTEKRKLNTERSRKILLSAMKQSFKAYLPMLDEPQSFSTFVKNQNVASKYIAHCYKSSPGLSDCLQKGNDVLIMIGPEGDFSPTEVDLALQHGFTEFGLGVSRLRTETAAVASCLLANHLNGII